MNKKRKIIIGVISIIFLVVSVYLVVLNTSITGNIIKGNSEKCKNGELMAEDGSCVNKDFYKKKSDCWFLDDGRKVCLLATDVKIEGGEVVEVDNKIKDKSNNGVSHEKQKSTNQESNENETGGLSLN